MGLGGNTRRQRESGHLAHRVAERFIRIAGRQWKSVGAAKFKTHCLALLDRLEPEGLVSTKHGRPVARVLPYPPPPETLIGALRDKIVVRDDILSTGIAWQADAES